MSGRRILLALLLFAGFAVFFGRSALQDGGLDLGEEIEANFEDPRAADPAIATALVRRAEARWHNETPFDADALDVVGPPLWLCRYTAGRTPVCARGEGERLSDAVDSAVGALGTRGEPVDAWKLDFELASREASWPEAANRHEAGTFGMRVGDAVLLPSEMLERGLFLSADEDDPPQYNTDAIVALLAARGAVIGGEAFPFTRIRTASWVARREGTELTAIRTYRVHAYEDPDITRPEVLLQRAIFAAEHLAAIVGPDGRIRYRFDVQNGQEKRGQNLLRHAGSTYSLVQAYARTGHLPWKASAERAIRYLLSKSASDERTGPYGGGLGRYIVEGSHIKLGGAGLSLVALAEWQRVTGETTYTDRAREFATFLVSQQQQSGEFVYFASKQPGGQPRDDTSAYYPGEAILGLVSFHALDPNPDWLNTAKRGADWLIDVRDAGKQPTRLDNDHWLMIALERLHAATHDPRYIEHAKRLAEAVRAQHRKQEGHEARHRDYRGGYYEPPRATPASTRAEGLIAVITLLDRTNTPHDLRPLLFDTVGHLLRSQYMPELCYWMPDCDAVVGGFAGGIVDIEMRNDYTQHALSALLGTERILGQVPGSIDVEAIRSAR